MYQYTAPSTVLLALRQRFQVAGSIRVKGPRMGTRFPTLPYPYSEHAYRFPQSPCVTCGNISHLQVGTPLTRRWEGLSPTGRRVSHPRVGGSSTCGSDSVDL